MTEPSPEGGRRWRPTLGQTLYSIVIGVIIVVIGTILQPWIPGNAGEESGAPALERYGAPSSLGDNGATCGPLSAPDPAPGALRPGLAGLDLDAAARRIPQPPEDEHRPRFTHSVRVEPYGVLQLSVIVANAGPKLARGVRVRIVAPRAPARSMAISTSVESVNARPTARYESAGIVSLVSSTRGPVRLVNIRGVAVNGNQRGKTIYWGRSEYLPRCELTVRRGDRRLELVVPAPTADGNLATGLGNAFRVTLLADVAPATSSS